MLDPANIPPPGTAQIRPEPVNLRLRRGPGEARRRSKAARRSLEIYFNGSYLIDMLKYESEQVKICQQTSESASWRCRPKSRKSRDT